MRCFALPLLCLPLAAQAAWTQLYPQQNAPLRADAIYVPHEASGSLLQLFGFDLPSFAPATQAWRFQSGTWAPVPGPVSPPHRYAPAYAYDELHQTSILFGGSGTGTSTDLGDTWLWNGSTWTQPTSPAHPSPRQNAAMAFDANRGVVVLFGGVTNGTALGDTWEWNGSAWQLRTLANAPAARHGARLAFDPVNGSLLLHGGTSIVSSSAFTLNDT